MRVLFPVALQVFPWSLLSARLPEPPSIETIAQTQALPPDSLDFPTPDRSAFPIISNKKNLVPAALHLPFSRRRSLPLTSLFPYWGALCLATYPHFY